MSQGLERSHEKKDNMLKIAKILTKESNILPKWLGMLQPSMNYASSCPSDLKSENPLNLPHLPVPNLDDTLKKFLRSVKPHLNDVEFSYACRAVQNFGRCEGRKLQALLEQRAKKHRNWLEDWWVHAAYLDFRSSVVIHSNPGLVFPFRKFSTLTDQLEYTARSILAVLDYKDRIDNNIIPTDKMGSSPLDMSQYKKMFGTCRVPGLARDTMSYNDTKHITVMHKGHIFHLDLWGEDNVKLSMEQIVKQLKLIMQASPQPAEYPVGVLTSEERNNWGKAYEILSKGKVNKSNFADIQESLFVVCLDEPVGVWTLATKDAKQTLAGEQTIHGSGCSFNGCNRWFDKTVQLIVGRDGVTGLCYEHTPAEGQPIAILTDFIMEFVEIKKGSLRDPSSKVQPPKRLDFDISDDIVKAISSAKDHLDKMVYDLDLNCFTYSKYGKDFIKSQKLSPDSYLQMAFQYAFYRLHKSPAAHYESAATRLFIGGRTETIRSCSIESVAFAKAMLDPDLTNKDKVAAMKAAIKSHKDYAVMAMKGLGVDRHLLGLKLIALEIGDPIPSFYSEKAFTKSSHMRISTSQVACKCDAFMCYGPLVPDGYATCYNPRDTDMNFATSAFRSNTETDLNCYRQSLELSLDEMHDLLANTTKAKL